METAEFIIHGTQSKLHRLLIVVPSKESWEKQQTQAFFQISNEESIITIKLPLQEVKKAVKEIKPDCVMVVRGAKTSDYLIVTIVDQALRKIELTAVRGGTRAMSAEFMADNLESVLLLATDT